MVNNAVSSYDENQAAENASTAWNTWKSDQAEVITGLTESSYALIVKLVTEFTKTLTNLTGSDQTANANSKTELENLAQQIIQHIEDVRPV
ncbi:MAG: hypothetical protein F6K23_39950 [Okeania sp. SIO2C9]|uniref:hypothetical protein n=1 Tax=Okeania sp. SIO2C9 TaxID=2607791 RepID=UPI0013BFDEC3|nr:hypothetical protein [Okeania sp. SIO2C9]NEQ78628.1 hypothetical protein [Okeania sp. SIO2C9]